MLRICIPVHNEATTVGVLLWRLRSVFQGFSREYDVVVYDDASTDGTWEVLEPYQSVMPLTVLRGSVHRGYAASIDALVRHVAADDEYARRDAMVLLQGDFTESPEHLPELVKRFEGGADLVAVHRTTSDATPADERRLRRWGRWAVKPFLRLPPVADPFTGFRLVRISVLRELIKALGSRAVCTGEGWAANIDFALNVAPFARRIENVEFAPRYDVRQRASRRRGWPDVVALFHWARAARSANRPAPGGKPAPDALARTDRPSDVSVMPISTERTNKTVERQDRTRRERSGRPERDRGGRGPRAVEGVEGNADQPPREPRPPREERTAEERTARSERGPHPERTSRQERPPMATTGAEGAPVQAVRPAREPRPPRQDRTARPAREQVSAAGEADAAGLPDGAEQPTEGAELTAADGLQPATPTEEKRARKRRRRSRRNRGERSATDPGASDEPDRIDSGRQQVGTSRGTDGAEDGVADGDDDGGDGGDGVESAGDAPGEAPGDASARKRRSRRRRRGRRPNGADTGGGTGSPPAAEPPAS